MVPSLFSACLEGWEGPSQLLMGASLPVSWSSHTVLWRDVIMPPLLTHLLCNCAWEEHDWSMTICFIWTLSFTASVVSLMWTKLLLFYTELYYTKLNKTSLFFMLIVPNLHIKLSTVPVAQLACRCFWTCHHAPTTVISAKSSLLIVMVWMFLFG